MILAPAVCLALSLRLARLAHLANFFGTDTLSAIVAANRWYGMQNDMTVFSIPAAEHSTMTTWGREH